MAHYPLLLHTSSRQYEYSSKPATLWSDASSKLAVPPIVFTASCVCVCGVRCVVNDCNTIVKRICTLIDWMVQTQYKTGDRWLGIQKALGVEWLAALDVEHGGKDAELSRATERAGTSHQVVMHLGSACRRARRDRARERESERARVRRVATVCEWP